MVKRSNVIWNVKFSFFYCYSTFHKFINCFGNLPTYVCVCHCLLCKINSPCLYTQNNKKLLLQHKTYVNSCSLCVPSSCGGNSTCARDYTKANKSRTLRIRFFLLLGRVDESHLAFHFFVTCKSRVVAKLIIIC